MQKTNRLNPEHPITDRRLRSIAGLLWLQPACFIIINLYFVLELVLYYIKFFEFVGKAYFFNTILFPVFLLITGAAAYGAIYKERDYIAMKRCALGSIMAGAALLALHYYASYIEPYQLKVRTVTYATDKISQPLNVLHISDIQSSQVGDYEASVFEKIKQLNPDLILHTGDLLQPRPPATWDSEFTKIAALFDQLSPPLGMYTIEGNTDVFRPRDFQNGVGPMKILYATEAIIPFDGTNIRIFGLHVRQSRHKRYDSSATRDWLNSCRDDELTILLGHMPTFMLHVADMPIDLCLAGHTHGGQIRIPGFGALSVLCEFPRQWGRGYRKIGQTTINVSAGVGSEHADGIPPIRLFCPPEMTMIKITPSLIKQSPHPPGEG